MASTSLDDYFQNENPPLAPARDLAGWPEEVRGTVDAVCQVFNLTPPTRLRKRGDSFAFWVQSARELADACRPFRVMEVLIDVQRDVTVAMHRGRDLTISGPHSLVNLARAKAERMGIDRDMADVNSEAAQAARRRYKESLDMYLENDEPRKRYSAEYGERK